METGSYPLRWGRWCESSVGGRRDGNGWCPSAELGCCSCGGPSGKAIAMPG